MWLASRSSSSAIAAQRLGAQRRRGTGQGFDGLAVGQRVADGRVAGHRLHVVDRALRRPADERPLDAAMLIAERDLQVKDMLAVALETEMARLDDARMDGPDGDLVDLVAVHA